MLQSEIDIHYRKSGRTVRATSDVRHTQKICSRIGVMTSCSIGRSPKRPDFFP
jgi:hypothetical protein